MGSGFFIESNGYYGAWAIDAIDPTGEEFPVAELDGRWYFRERTFYDDLHEGLRPALEVWAHVQSLPEPGFAVIALGKGLGCRVVAEGAQVLAGGDGFPDRRLRCLFTPGHAPGAVCFSVPDLGVVLSGDTTTLTMAGGATMTYSLDAIGALRHQRQRRRHRGADAVEADIGALVDDHRAAGPRVLPETAAHFVAIHLGHADIEEHQIRLEAGLHAVEDMDVQAE